MRLSLLFTLALLAWPPLAGTAQQRPSLEGNYAGTLAETLHLKLHLQTAPGGALSGTLDSLDQGASGIPCADFHLDGTTLSFTVPSVHGSWKGTVSADGSTLTGAWDQGNPMALNFSRDTFVPAAKPSPVDGIWLGELHAGSNTLRVQITVKSDASGKESCALDSLDQGAMGLQCDHVELSGDSFSFDVPAVHGYWAGKLSDDGKTLNGTWDQGSPLTLNFVRQLTALAAKPVPPPTYDPAMPPVSAADLQSVLDRDLAKALESGDLAPSTGVGVSIGVVEHGASRVFSYGAAKPDSVFEIGSITKTFTGLILAQMIEQGKVKLDEPVRELLPPGTVAKPAGAEITLLDLVTQHSGLPRLPDNMDPADKKNPYADYSAARLYAFLSKHGVERPPDAGFLYSNLGFGLLGQALAVRAGVSYPELLRNEVTAPLGLTDTTVALTPAQRSRFLPGHDGSHRPAGAWDLNAVSGAGAIRSTAGDMLAYLEAQLHPESVKPVTGVATGSSLQAALNLTHQLRADASPGMRIGFAWLYKTDSGNYWHNGATGGYSAYGFFNPTGDYAAVVLVNMSIGEKGSFADRLGEHISERLAGKPAISLGD
ncbi:MAG: serine hydrolase domain-containing protein [Terracidiphilus sp.]